MAKKQSFQDENQRTVEGNESHERCSIELSKLAKENVRHEQGSMQQQVLPPDGGICAYMVLLSAFISFGVTFAVILCYENNINNSYFIHHSKKMWYYRHFSYDKALILAPITGIMADKIGLRYTSLLGGLLSTSGLFFSQYFLDELNAFSMPYFILGCQIVLGSALSLISSYAILGHYFKRHLGKACGFVMMAVQLVHYLLYTLLLDNDLQFSFQKLSVISSLVIVASIALKPMAPLPQKCLRIDFNKRKLFKFLTYAFGLSVALLGFISDRQTMIQYIQEVFPNKMWDFFDYNLFVIIKGSGFLISGIIADLCHRNRFMLQEILFVCIGFGNILLAFISNYTLAQILHKASTLISCCTITLFCPIAFDIFGPSGATHALGVLMSLWAWSWNLGNGISYYFDHAGGSISSLFVLSGFFPIIGAVVMFVALRLLDRHTRI